MMKSDPKADPDSQLLLELLQKRLRSAKRSQRDLERELNLGHGTIGNILRGRTELRMRHLKMLGETLGFDPMELLMEAFGSSGSSRPFPALTAAVREELRELISEALREELDRRGIGVGMGAGMGAAKRGRSR